MPDWIIESSWEVCNKVGGIYTVLASRAKTLVDRIGDRLLFVGPDFWLGKENPLFLEDATIYPEWHQRAVEDGLKMRIGRWNIPGTPIAILVDFHDEFHNRNEIYAQMWEDYGVDSLHAYGDYDEACMFAIAAAKVVEHLYRHIILGCGEHGRVIYQCHEWMLGMSLLYVKKHVPQIATIFTTHATTIGRCIAGNGKPLYEYLWAYNGDQMARELNVESKHSLEKQAAWHADCFTTVSGITSRECTELLDKSPDVVLPNGFDDSFVPATREAFDAQRNAARAKLTQMAQQMAGITPYGGGEPLIVSISGRYEYRNKGLDMYLEAMRRLGRGEGIGRQVLAFIFVPYYNASAVEVYTDSRVAIIPVPHYLEDYYETIIGCDLCVYPSYYEPWGYTPLEATAFSVPCVTTDLAGFGLWAKGREGVHVIHRTDYNFDEATGEITSAIRRFAGRTGEEVRGLRQAASALAKSALWKEFISYYDEAYGVALHNASERMTE